MSDFYAKSHDFGMLTQFKLPNWVWMQKQVLTLLDAYNASQQIKCARLR